MLTSEQTRLLKQAFEERDRAYYETLPDEQQLKEITFSEKLQEKMQRLINRSEWKIYPLINTLAKRVACIAVLIIAAAGVTTFSVSSLREPFLQFCVNTYDTFAQLVFPNHNEEVDFTAIIPTYIPVGFEQSYCKEMSESLEIEYRNNEDQTILYTQTPVTEDGLYVDMECDVWDKVVLQQGTEALLAEKYDSVFLVFQKDQYIIQISGQIDQTELIDIANSVIE